MIVESSEFLLNDPQAEKCVHYRSVSEEYSQRDYSCNNLSTPNFNQSTNMALSLLALPVGVIEQLAKVRLDEPIAGYHPAAPRKTYVFWVLRELGHPGLGAGAWEARHSVLKPTLANVAKMGDTDWCRVMVEGGADKEAGEEAKTGAYGARRSGRGLG